MLTAAQDSRVYEGKVEQPDLRTWLSFYRSHRSLLEGFLEFDPSFAVTYGVMSFAYWYKSEKGVYAKPDQIYKSIYDFREGHEIFQEYISFLCEEPTEEMKKEKEKTVNDFIKRPESYYFFRVYLPCWLLYGKFPGQLIRSARQGDLESLDKLLRLDSSVVFDQKISEIFHQIRMQKKSKFEQLCKSLTASPKRKITLLKVKFLIAGFIAALSEMFGQKLSEPEIRELFDAVEKDDKNGSIDTDLPEGADAFSKAIRREKKFWEEAFS